ncbi:hypothetical protein [Gemella cuniculi]|uniref:hypothetical protein n=1 Tax=Gemella cuniculi TaxID=150240 RepID=UPI0004171717|nr:hypothetical protein [Gemella cuniculi]
MEKYNYNKELIEKLNIKNFIEQYNFTNEKYNEAIFCALSSLYEHYKQKNPSTRVILLGDYYSFEYYSLLKDNLDKLKNLTQVMQEGYLKFLNKSIDFRNFSLEIISTWFAFYGRELQKSDVELINIIDSYGDNDVKKI